MLLKIILRVLPWLMILSYFDSITRSNVAGVREQLLAALNMKDSDYNIIASLFYASYVIFQVPSTAILGNLAPSKRYGVACIVLGLVGCMPGFVTTFWQFCIARFLLGLVQGGNFPGICFTMAQWFPVNERASAMSYVGIASSLAQISTGAIAYGLLQVKRFAGFAGWQLVFIVEGFPAIIGGILMLFFMPDGPDTSNWLTNEEKAKVKSLAVSSCHAKKDEYESLKTKTRKLIRVFTNWKLVLLGIAFMLNTTAFTFYLYYAPSIISSLGIPDYKSNLFTVPLTIVNTAIGIIFSKLCSRYCKGRWPICTIIASLGSAAACTLLGFSLNMNNHTFVWIGLILLNMLQGVWYNPGFTWVSMEAGEVPEQANLNIAFVNSLANVGAMLGPQITSLASLFGHSAGSYGTSLFLAASLQVCGNMLFIFLAILRGKRYKELYKNSLLHHSKNINESINDVINENMSTNIVNASVLSVNLSEEEELGKLLP